MGHMKRAIEWEKEQWAKRTAVHPVHMTFTRFEGWLCEFTEEFIRGPIRVRVATPDKVREMAERGGALFNPESRQMLEYGIKSGRGGVTLKLTAEQLANLKGGRP